MFFQSCPLQYFSPSKHPFTSQLPFEIQIFGKSLADPQDLTESDSYLIVPTFAVTSPLQSLPHVTTTHYVSYIWAFQCDVLSAWNGQPLLYTLVLCSHLSAGQLLPLQSLARFPSSGNPFLTFLVSSRCHSYVCHTTLPTACLVPWQGSIVFVHLCLCIRLSRSVSNETLVGTKCIAVHPGAVQGRINGFLNE